VLSLPGFSLPTPGALYRPQRIILNYSKSYRAKAQPARPKTYRPGTQAPGALPVVPGPSLLVVFSALIFPGRWPSWPVFFPSWPGFMAGGARSLVQGPRTKLRLKRNKNNGLEPKKLRPGPGLTSGRKDHVRHKYYKNKIIWYKRAENCFT